MLMNTAQRVPDKRALNAIPRTFILPQMCVLRNIILCGTLKVKHIQQVEILVKSTLVSY